MEESLNESVEAASVPNGYAASCGSAFPLWRIPRKTFVIYYAINIWSVDRNNNNNYNNNSNDEG